MALCVWLSYHLSIRLSVCASIHLFVHQSVCLCLFALRGTIGQKCLKITMLVSLVITTPLTNGVEQVEPCKAEWIKVECSSAELTEREWSNASSVSKRVILFPFVSNMSFWNIMWDLSFCIKASGSCLSVSAKRRRPVSLFWRGDNWSWDRVLWERQCSYPVS